MTYRSVVGDVCTAIVLVVNDDGTANIEVQQVLDERGRPRHRNPLRLIYEHVSLAMLEPGQ